MNQVDASQTPQAPVSRVQHLVPASAILALAITVAWLSYTREPASAFLFPRIIGTVMLLLAVWNFLRALLGMAKVGHGLSVGTITRIAPGVSVMLLYVYFAIEALGFHSASFLAFLSLYSLYDPADHTLPASWIKRILVTSGFMIVIYALFSVLLKVQIPRGMFF